MRRVLLRGACTAVLIVTGCASAQLATQAVPPPTSPSASSTPPTAVASPTMNAAPPAQVIPSGYPAAKASVLAAEDRARLRYSGKPMVSASFPPIQGTLVRGIYVPGQDPQLRDEFSITNAWAGPGLSAWEAVDAGSIPLATGEGLTDHARDEAAIFVFTAPTDPNSALPRTIVGIFKPSQDLHGQFTITSIDGTTITLSLSGSSTVYHFDTSTLRFG
jgi:hypothetical protein